MQRGTKSCPGATAKNRLDHISHLRFPKPPSLQLCSRQAPAGPVIWLPINRLTVRGQTVAFVLSSFLLQGPSCYAGIIKLVETESIAEERDLSAQDDVLDAGYTPIIKTKPLTLQRLCPSREEGGQSMHKLTKWIN